MAHDPLYDGVKWGGGGWANRTSMRRTRFMTASNGGKSMVKIEDWCSALPDEHKKS